jgi:hypothetical protein
MLTITGSQVPLDILNELPYCSTPIRILKRQSIVRSRRLSPDYKRVLLPLILLLTPYGRLQYDSPEIRLRAGDKRGCRGIVVIVARAERGALVDPSLAYELVYLFPISIQQHYMRQKKKGKYLDAFKLMVIPVCPALGIMVDIDIVV